MAMVLTETKEMDRDRWLEERRRGIGGSDAAAIAGLNPYKSSVELYLEKRGEIEPKDAGEAAYWGTVLEDVVAHEFAARNRVRIQRRNAILRHPEHDWMLANVDRMIVGTEDGPGVLECKTASEYKRAEWGEDEVPDAYMLQLQHYLAVTGYSYGWLAVLIGGNKYRQYRVERDDELIDSLIRIEADFWQRVQDGTPPDLDGSDAASDLLSRMYPESKPEEIDLPAEAEELIRKRDEAREVEQKWAAERKEAENRLKALLGECEVGWIGDRKVVWKTITSNRLDTKRLKDERPDVYEAFTKPSTFRRFEIKEGA